MKDKKPSTDLPRDEDIRNLIYHPPPVEEKIPMYHSKFSSKVREDARKVKDCHKTFGYAEVPLEPPTNFLKKKTRIVRRPLVEKHKYVGEPKPGLPNRMSQKETDKKEEKNFRRDNIVRVVRAVPKQPVPQIVDTRTGHTQSLEPSGLQPKYIYSKEFGKVPKYLRKGGSLTQRDKEEKEEKKTKPPLRYVTEEEREEMLQGLKKNWEELQKEFQLLPMVTDTVPKIKRKTQLEKQLKDLEKDIDLIERNPVIYVATVASDVNNNE
ncbi:enkurin isoform X2 [Macrosteles quadrilineatus]|uniref:enkurin isoform X2 n=1 Tax=Macrosteles quadrilineatus TaxID=74068 RepID=UPI0023E26FB3|nr:enkurin isoform X2 [Macrosteles quadrilineatus]